MQVFNIKVDKGHKVKTSPPTYHVPAHTNEEFLFTIDPDSEDEYDLKDVKIDGAPFSEERVNRKTIRVNDDNMLHWKKGDVTYKYTVKVKPVAGGKQLVEDPTIVNQ